VSLCRKVPAASKSIYASEGPYEHAKLQKLKEDVAAAYPAKSYPRPSEFAELVFHDLEACIYYLP
jgi:hypothetical protein